MILFQIKFRALVIRPCTTMGGPIELPNSNISHSHMVCIQNISLIIILLFLAFIVMNESCDHRATFKERFGTIIPNLMRTSIAHPLKYLVLPQTNIITLDRAPRSLEFHINTLSNAQDPFIF